MFLLTLETSSEPGPVINFTTNVPLGPWDLLKRSQGPRGTFVVKLMTGPGCKEVSRAKRNNCGKIDDRTWFWRGLKGQEEHLYYYLCNQCLSPLKVRVQIPLTRGVLDTTLCDNVCQWLATGRWFSPTQADMG
jgi:hypothetical protein